tara:strand:- start:221 stop:334 length:114 start_codon:yes stop_codon:yes gene_type:complete
MEPDKLTDEELKPPHYPLAADEKGDEWWKGKAAEARR